MLGLSEANRQPDTRHTTAKKNSYWTAVTMKLLWTVVFLMYCAGESDAISKCETRIHCCTLE